jgi:hypothetical protein
MDTNPAMRIGSLTWAAGNTALLLALILGAASCSNKQNYSFAIMPTVEQFQPRQLTRVTSSVSPRVRILFVEDNSGSMDKYQALLSTGFQNFANTYLGQKGLDLSVAIITTDTYLAGNINDPSNYGPFMGKCLSRLLPGVHDGLVPALADGILNAFNSDCSLTPAALQKLQTSGTRSLRPILSTIPADGSDPTPAYSAQLVSDFKININKGTVGSGNERGMQSFYQFMTDNESRPECAQVPAADPSCFFPHYDSRLVLVKPINVVVVLSDEHDQSVTNFGVPGAAAIDHSPAAMQNMTDAQVMSSAAADAALFKQSLDSFFLSLNAAATTDPNYSVMSIVNISCNGALDTTCGLQSNGMRDPNERWGAEYASLVDHLAGYAGDSVRLPQTGDPNNSSAKFSQVYDINGTDYSGLFTFIADRISAESTLVDYTVFKLQNRISSTLEMKVILTLGNGTEIQIPRDWLSTQDGYELLIATQYLSLIPPGDTKASLAVYYTPVCYGQYCSG